MVWGDHRMFFFSCVWGLVWVWMLHAAAHAMRKESFLKHLKKKNLGKEWRDDATLRLDIDREREKRD